MIDSAYFLGALPAVRCNLCGEPRNKRFYCTRAKRNGEAIGAGGCSDVLFCLGKLHFKPAFCTSNQQPIPCL